MTAVAALLDDPIEEVRLSAFAFLRQAHWRAAQAVPGLGRCLDDGSPAVRAAAAQALAEIGAPANSVLPALTRLINDD